MSTTRSLTVSAPGDVRLLTRSQLGPGAGEVLVEPLLVGLCGTDLEIIDGRVDPAYVRYPVVLGHEWCGTVTEVAPGEDHDLEGALVVVEGVVPCWRCLRCREGLTNLCLHYDEIGFTRDGAATDALAVASSLVHRIADHVDPAEAVLVEPSAVVYRALRRVDPRPGQQVLVIGDGTIGLLAAHLVRRLWAPGRVDLLGWRPSQEGLARSSGATAFETDPSSLARDYDLVVEAAGSPEAVGTGLGKLRRGGVLLLLGLSGHGASVPVPVDDLVDGDLAVIGSFSYTSQSFGELVGLLNAGAISPGFLVTHRYPLVRWQAAVQQLRSPTGARGKVLVEIRPRTQAPPEPSLVGGPPPEI